MTARVVHCWLVTAIGVLFVLGCSRGPSRPKTYPVTGTVTMNGQPVEGATVIFVPKSAAAGPAGSAGGTQAQGPQVATGETDAQGRYQLGTFAKGDGAIPGEYLVKVFKYPKAATPAGTGGGEEEYRPPEENAPPPPAPKNLLPEKYANENTSGLSFTVEPKSNTFDIQLTP
ncbi:hypothetical protein [Thermogutta sp.]|uniref:hypothetical protein n=1 Tax=Thermogutta sp. TaxID=1962930 RepID=UPI003C7A19E5